MSSKAAERENVIRIGLQAEPAFCAAIVDRDSMSSGLLADALVRDLKCDAIAIRSGNLLQALRTRHVDLLVISADLNAKSGAGFDLSRAVSCAHPNIPIVVLLD